MNLFTELKRRNVFRVAIAYAVVGWLLAQGASIFLPNFGAPAWVMPVFLGLVIAGFPIAIVLAWAFEMTPEGVKRTAEETKVVVPADKPAVPSAPATPSIAVMPFVNMSSDPEQEYFSDGLSEELLNKLARLKGLQVAGRTSSFHFKGKNEDLRVIGETLGVANVLEGSVRKSGDRVRITAQLVKSADGYHLWSETYDRTFEDIFAIQDEIAESVAKALSVTLGVGELGHVEGMTRNVEAYDAYLQGKLALEGAVSQAISRGRIASLERAVKLDPSFALAWAALALAYHMTNRYDNPANSADWRAKAERALAHAVELAPNAPDVLSAAGRAAMARNDWTKAEQMFRTASDLYGNAALSWNYGYFLLTVGRARKALDYMLGARQAEPLNVEISVMLGTAYDEIGKSAEALAELDRGDGIGEPQAYSRGTALAVAVGMRDRAEIARRIDLNIEVDEIGRPIYTAIRPLLDDTPAGQAELRRLYADPAFSSPQHRVVIAEWAVYFGDDALSLSAWKDVFAHGGQVSAGAVLWMRLLGGMRRLPEFKDFLRDIGLVDYWRQTGDWGDFCRPVGDDDFECV